MSGKELNNLKRPAGICRDPTKPRHQIATALEAEIKNERVIHLYMDKLILKLPLLKGNLTVMAMNRLSFISTNQVKL